MSIKQSRDIFTTILSNHQEHLRSILRSMPNVEANGCLRLALHYLSDDLEKAIQSIDAGEYDGWLNTRDKV